MTLVFSSDKLTAVNADKVQRFYVDISREDRFAICADGIDLSYHKDVEKAKKELSKMADYLWFDSPCVYVMENTN